MRLSRVRLGDVVECDVKGRRFYAKVHGKPADGGLTIQPFDRRITYLHVVANQVIGLYRQVA